MMNLRSTARVVVWAITLTAVLGALHPITAQSNDSLLDRVTTLDLTGERLEEALRRLQQSTGVHLAYSPDLIPGDRLVSCDCAGLSVREALTRILSGTGLVYTATSSHIRIAPAGRAVRQNGNSQRDTTGTVVGTVTDADTGAPIANAMIQLDGRGVLSNDNGRFILVNMPPGPYELTVSGLGWDPASVTDVMVTADETTTVDVSLHRRVIPLSAVVVSPGTFGILDEVSEFALQTLTREQIETIPQIGEDVFRAVKRLPGVASDDISTRLNIRGGTDREVLFVLDGMELIDPYHLKDFEGALGIVDVQSVGGIDLHTGGFPVDYGNRTTGMFNMETRNPPSDERRTTLGLSFTNASFMSQGTFGEGRGQWLFSARRGYMDVVLKLTDADDDLSPQYYDVLGKIKYQLGSRHLLSGHFLLARDHLRLDVENLGDEDGFLSTRWGSGYGWLTWKAFYTPWLTSSTMVSVGQVTRRRAGNIEDPGRIEGPEAAVVSDVGKMDFGGIRHEWTVDFSDRFALRAGLDARRSLADYDYLHWTRSLEAGDQDTRTGVYDTTQVSFDPTGTQIGSWAATRFRPIPQLITEIGLRYDHHSHTGDSDISPRVSAVLDLGDRTTFRTSWGQYFQSQALHELEVADGEDTFAPSEQATQLALGVEHRFNSGISARAEVYSRDTENPRRQYVNLWRELLAFPELEGDRILLNPTEARARGVELLVSQDAESWDWSGSYAHAVAEDRIGDRWVPRWLDQRHTVVLTLGYRPSPKWFATGAWHFHSGWPFTPQEIVFDTLTVYRDTGEQYPLNWREEFGPINSIRLPAYHRLDLRVTRRFELRRGRLDVYLDLFNAYNQQNLRSYNFGTEFQNNRWVRVRYPDEELLPILPSIGFRWEF